MTENSNNNSNESSHRFTDEQTDKRMHEHIMNEKDVISEDDIRNIKTDMGQSDEHQGNETHIAKEQAPKFEEENNKKQNEAVKDNDDPDIKTSWNILENE